MAIKNSERKNSQVASCDGCGVCCLHMGYPAFIDGSETSPPEQYWLDLPDSLRKPLIEYRNQYVAPADGELDGPCYWLDPETRKCMHHEYRPAVCRDFRIGSPGCLEWRAYYRIGLPREEQTD